jgi:two-component system response regulator PilR (NtrC family)
MPALREKPEDLPALAEHFLEKYRRSVGKPIAGGISKTALECLESYDWPGNVRQLENVIERAVALETSEQIQPESLPAEVRRGAIEGDQLDIALPEGGIDLEQHLEIMRRRYMQEAMNRSGHVQTRAAELLGMTFRSFRYFAKKYEMNSRNADQEPAAAVERTEEEATVLVGGSN